MAQPDHQDNVPSKALGLPEILSTVLGHVYQDYVNTDDRTIFTCPFVNSLWETEANRYLWIYVGASTTAGNFPVLRNLARIIPERQQKYANYIRRLQITREAYLLTDAAEFAEDKKERDTDGESHITRWEGYLNPRFKNLKFPRLVELTVEPPLRLQKAQYAHSSLEQYFGPNLCDVWISDDPVSMESPVELLAFGVSGY